VTPIFIVSNSSILHFLPSFAVLTLEFIPEPDLALAGLVASGVVSLVALGRRRQQERRTHMT
jgi:CHASE1-domain containing sensor protein